LRIWLPKSTLRTSPRSLASSSARRFSSRSTSLDLSMRMATALFCSCERSFWHCTTMLVGRCVMRTAELVLFTCCPPAPLVSDDADVEINDDDLRIDTYRSSGAGGQHVNKTSSAVRITHLPTNIVVQCQNERSQLQNKAVAMRMLKSKLVDREENRLADELARERGEVRNVDFGSQIRSYVLHPYQMVKDLRTGHEVGNAQGVLDGDLDGFVHEYLVWRAGGSAPRK